MVTADQMDEGFGGGRGGSGDRGGDRGGDRKSAAFKKKRMKRRASFRKKRPPADMTFDYKDISRLYQFLGDDGKVVGARISGLRGYQQRELTTAVKRARHIGFVSPLRRDFIH